MRTLRFLYRTLGLLTLTWVAHFSTPVHADDASVLIEKSVTALGGEQNILKHRAATWTESGRLIFAEKVYPYTSTNAVQLPGKFRSELRIENLNVMLRVVNGDKGWMRIAGQTREMSKDELLGENEELQKLWIRHVLPLRDKTFKLMTIGEHLVEDRATLGLRITTEDRRDVEVFFDKETGLLIKLNRRATLEGKERQLEEFFKEYRDLDGTKIPMKMTTTLDGKLYQEAEVKTYKAAEKLDDELFAIPK